MSEEIRNALAAQADTLSSLIKSGQYADAFVQCQEVQRSLVLAQTGILERIKAGLRDLLEMK